MIGILNLVKKKSEKKIQTGWKSKYMNITFSMSSQLWFHFNIDYIRQFLITCVLVDKAILPKITYTDVYDTYYKSSI